MARSLAFVTASEGRFEIRRWSPGAASSKALLAGAEAPSGLAWSPDGGQLAFVKRVPAVPAAVAVPAWEALRNAEVERAGASTARR